MDTTALRHFTARLRVNVSAAAGVMVAVAVAPFAPWQLAALAGWVALALVLLGWVWAEVTGCDAAETRARATFVDNSRTTAVAVMVMASSVSLVAVALGLAKAQHVEGGMSVALTVGSALTVLLSWCVVHTMFMLRYAHLYYRGVAGGIEFPSGREPDFGDFAYVAFTIGTAFAVSDTQVTSREIRRSVTGHSLVSYLFGAVIVGLAINVTAGLIR